MNGQFMINYINNSITRRSLTSLDYVCACVFFLLEKSMRVSRVLVDNVGATPIEIRISKLIDSTDNWQTTVKSHLDE